MVCLLSRIKEAVKYGIESCYFEQVTGTGFSGKLQLTVENFNPSDGNYHYSTDISIFLDKMYF